MDIHMIYKEYIYDQISNMYDHTFIIDLIKQKNCNYTENKNGIYLDLNNIDKPILKEIYENIKNQNLKNNYNNDNENIIENIKTEFSNQKKQTKIVEKKENKYIYLSEFTKIEKEIINFVKQI
tara:strand:+ start:1782 stop:2150 length:369 start_codon:yes stop_codon:yes gene_type:complete